MPVLPSFYRMLALTILVASLSACGSLFADVRTVPHGVAGQAAANLRIRKMDDPASTDDAQRIQQIIPNLQSSGYSQFGPDDTPGRYQLVEFAVNKLIGVTDFSTPWKMAKFGYGCARDSGYLAWQGYHLDQSDQSPIQAPVDDLNSQGVVVVLSGDHEFNGEDAAACFGLGSENGANGGPTFAFCPIEHHELRTVVESEARDNLYYILSGGTGDFCSDVSQWYVNLPLSQ